MVTVLEMDERRKAKLRERLFDALRAASDAIDGGTYCCHFTLPMPGISYVEGVELESVAIVDPLEPALVLLPDAEIGHDSLEDAASRHGFDVQAASDIVAEVGEVQ